MPKDINAAAAAKMRGFAESFFPFLSIFTKPPPTPPEAS